MIEQLWARVISCFLTGAFVWFEYPYNLLQSKIHLIQALNHQRPEILIETKAEIPGGTRGTRPPHPGKNWICPPQINHCEHKEI